MQLFDCRLLVFTVVFPALLLASWDSWADDSDIHKTVGDVEIFIGVLPVEIIRGRGTMKHGEPHGEMHHGAPTRRNAYHLVVALFDRDSGVRITEANVSATITASGLPVSKKDLEPMEIRGLVSYGNYFTMSSQMPNRISLVIKSPGRKNLRAEFDVLAAR